MTLTNSQTLHSGGMKPWCSHHYAAQSWADEFSQQPLYQFDDLICLASTSNGSTGVTLRWPGENDTPHVADVMQPASLYMTHRSHCIGLCPENTDLVSDCGTCRHSSQVPRCQKFSWRNTPGAEFAVFGSCLVLMHCTVCRVCILQTAIPLLYKMLRKSAENTRQEVCENYSYLGLAHGKISHSGPWYVKAALRDCALLQAQNHRTGSVKAQLI